MLYQQHQHDVDVGFGAVMLVMAAMLIAGVTTGHAYLLPHWMRGLGLALGMVTIAAGIMVMVRGPKPHSVRYAIKPNGMPLPPDLTLDPHTGIISGHVPNEVGNYGFTLSVTDDREKRQ